MFAAMRLFDAACIQGNNPILHLFPSHWGAPMIAASATADDVRLKTDTVLRSLRRGEKKLEPISMTAGVTASQATNLCNLLSSRYVHALHSRYLNLGSACVSTSQAEHFFKERLADASLSDRSRVVGATGLCLRTLYSPREGKSFPTPRGRR